MPELPLKVKVDVSDLQKKAAYIQSFKLAQKKGVEDFRASLKSFRQGGGVDPTDFVVSGKSTRARSNMRVASTMFVSALRDTFASLASGQNPITVLLQQAPQVAQGFVMMGKSALFAILRFIPIVGAITAAAFAFVSLKGKIKAAEDALTSLNKLRDPFSWFNSFSDKALYAMDSLLEKLGEFKTKMREAAGMEVSVEEVLYNRDRDKIETEYKRQNEILEAQKRAAQSRGQTSVVKDIDKKMVDAENAYYSRLSKFDSRARNAAGPRLAQLEADAQIARSRAERASTEYGMTSERKKALEDDLKKQIDWIEANKKMMGGSSGSLEKAVFDTAMLNKAELERQLYPLSILERTQRIASEQAQRDAAKAEGAAIDFQKFLTKVQDAAIKSKEEATSGKAHRAELRVIEAGASSWKSNRTSSDVTDFQRLSAYAGGPGSVTVDLTRQIANNTGRIIQQNERMFQRAFNVPKNTSRKF